MIAAARSYVSFYRGNWVLNRIANDRGRVVAAFIMIDLHLNGGRSGFTVSQLREQAERYSICSPNRMTALASLLRVSGYLKVVPTRDSRMRKLAPTDTLIRLHQERLHGILSAHCLITPNAAETIPHLYSEDFLADIARTYLAYWRAGFRLTGGQPGLEAIVERDAGLTILFLLLTGAPHHVGYRISDLARCFAISRTHALGVIRLGMDHGLIEQPVQGGPYIGTPYLIATMRSVFASIFQIQAESVRFALRRHQARQVAP